MLFHETTTTKFNNYLKALLAYFLTLSTFNFFRNTFLHTHRCNISQRQEVSTIQRQVINPVYDTSMEPYNTYSSSGPIYEQVPNGHEQEHIYSILESDESPDCCSTQLNDIDKEQNYHVEGVRVWRGRDVTAMRYRTTSKTDSN